MLAQRATLLADVPGVSHGFFGRRGGTSPQPWTGLNTSYTVTDAPARVTENLARIRFEIGLPPQSLVAPKQVHGVKVCEATDQTPLDEVEADAVFTTERNLGVGVRTADCAPILITDRQARFAAAIHAGWRSTVADVVGATVARLVAQVAVKPQDMVAAIGPCIGADRFEVGAEVIQAAKQLRPVEDFTRPSGEEKYLFDLRAFLEARLNDLGVSVVEQVPGCTLSETDKYFSHRAEAGNTGRQMSVIALCDPPAHVHHAEAMKLPEPSI